MRLGNRPADSLREVRLSLIPDTYAEGAVIVEFGKTRVMCTASFEPMVPQFLKGTGKGWVTAEYGMLPRSTHQRVRRDKAATSGRTQEIQRLIGRALRSVTDMQALGERQIVVDCDVLQADGGTRTASITGGFVALAHACKKLKDSNFILNFPLRNYVAAVSCGIVKGEALLDLCYEEDSAAEVDMNFVLTGGGDFVEVQGTAESKPFSQEQMNKMIELARVGHEALFAKQEELIGAFFKHKR